MAELSLAKVCPQCGTAIRGWHTRLLGRDAATQGALRDGKTTWGPFACTACGAKLVLILTDPKLVHKLAGAVLASIVAGFVLGFVIGWGGCFGCDMLLIGLFIAASAGWIISRSIKVEVVRTAPVFINDPGRPNALGGG
jgi:hypothetical protein